MTLVCPRCGSTITSRQLRVEWGSGGGVVCPRCGASLRYSPPYHLILAWGSFPILCFFLATKGVLYGAFFCIKITILWFFGSIGISYVLASFLPFKLKLSKPSGFEDEPLKLFDTRRK
jgi:hypothetical protein